MGREVTFLTAKLYHSTIVIRYTSWKGKKKRRRAWTPGRFCEVASHGKAFSFFSVFLKKISINCRFFTQKEHLPAQKKETFCMKKITSYLLRFCKTNSRPLLKKNTYLPQKKEVLIEKLKTVLPAVIFKKKFRTANFSKF